MTKERKADLLIATDPDCDRVGIAVLDNGEYKLMTGNEVGIMLTEYILSSLKEQGKLPKNPIVVKQLLPHISFLLSQANTVRKLRICSRALSISASL